MSKIVKVFGLIPCEAGAPKEFNGEIVNLTDDGLFFFENENYRPHIKQTEAVSLLYPNEIWVKEPDVSPYEDEGESDESVIVRDTQISNCYARRGSHWIRYIIDPKSLVITGEEDEEQAEIKALEIADIIVNKAHLKQVLQNAGITDPKILEQILLTL